MGRVFRRKSILLCSGYM